MAAFLLLFLLSSKEAHTETIIKSVKLLIQPESEVQRDTNVTLSCEPEVSHSPGLRPTYSYVFYKDYQPLSTESTEEGQISIPHTRVTDSGRYKCAVRIEEQRKESSVKDLTVKGLQTPTLTVNKRLLTEGEEVTAVCSAEDEDGLLTFFFKNGPEELYRRSTNSRHVEQTLTLNIGSVALFCYYSINLYSAVIQSEQSNTISVTVRELDIKPRIQVTPSSDVIEGDVIHFTCSMNTSDQRRSNLRIVLSRGHNTLSLNMTQKTYVLSTRSNDSGEYECISTAGLVYKSSAVNVTVKELFSPPVLNIHPAEVFEGDRFIISCQISSFASERIQREEIKFSIFRDNVPFYSDGRYNGTAGLPLNGIYMCLAEVKGIIKESRRKPFKAKTLVSKPEITVEGHVIVGKPFWIRCRSENGSFPVFYTLKKGQNIINKTRVSHHDDEARFTDIVTSPADISLYYCEAENNGVVSIKRSGELHATIIVPVGKPLLTVLPAPGNIQEEHDVTLICGVPKGSSPISFRFFGNGHKPLYSTTVETNSTSHVLTGVNKQDSGNYHCEALNLAKESKTSESVSIVVSLAVWKKALISSCCLLVLVLVLLFFVMFYKAKRGKKEMPARLSVKPAQPNSDESLALSSHDTYHSRQTARVNNTESVWSERPRDAEEEEEEVKYTEVHHSQLIDPTQLPVRKGTDTEYSELQKPHEAPEHIYDVTVFPAPAF